MNLNMIRPKNGTETLSLSITKNCETPIEETHRKADEILGFKLTKSRETFYFNPPISIEGSWMIGLTSLGDYNSIYNITKTNNFFEFYTDTFGEFSITELKNELEENLNISDITPYHLQHQIIGPRIFETYRKLRLRKSSTDGFIILLMG